MAEDDKSKIFEGKSAIVTGGSRGIGRAVVLMLARNGARVAFNYLSREHEAAALASEAAEASGTVCLASRADIRDFQSVKHWVEEVKEKLGGLDFLVNNAGIVRDKPLMMTLEEDWHDVIDTNLTGMFNATRACIVTFLKQRYGRVVNISSLSGLIGLPGQTNYSASKGGMNSFTRALAKETAAYGVRVNAVAPGFIETDMVADFDPTRRESVMKSIPLARFGSAGEVAGCVRFLLSDESGYMTGQILQIDGGLAIR